MIIEMIMLILCFTISFVISQYLFGGNYILLLLMFSLISILFYLAGALDFYIVVIMLLLDAIIFYLILFKNKNRVIN